MLGIGVECIVEHFTFPRPWIVPSEPIVSRENSLIYKCLPILPGIDRVNKPPPCSENRQAPGRTGLLLSVLLLLQIQEKSCRIVVAVYKFAIWSCFRLRLELWYLSTIQGSNHVVAHLLHQSLRTAPRHLLVVAWGILLSIAALREIKLIGVIERKKSLVSSWLLRNILRTLLIDPRRNSND